MGTILISLGLAVLVAGIVIGMVRGKRKAGKKKAGCGCCGDCSACGGCH
ncbi:MAG: FeoB-associated Cys-rich membrane protein [Clostridia bacterium]|nr:FeoB-associated Cys-rich membrane protein [Clostridia bacterium]